MIKEINQTIGYLRSAGISDPEIGIVLGTGLGRIANDIDIIRSVDYRDIPHFPLSTVESHSGKLIFGRLEGKKVLAMQGRFHYYEGYSLQKITYPIRIMKLLGIRYLLLSNAAGALNLQFKKGSLMLIEDHINLLPDNPLRGINMNEFGPRFPDMSQPYSRELNDRLIKIAEQEHIVLNKGIYIAVMGPNLETRAEYRMFRNFADAVGMSTVPEIIVANHMSVPCAAISVLTDECDPDNLTPAKIEDILETARKAEIQLIRILSLLIRELPSMNETETEK
jgi:purine-nucleoside phosphorylase